MSVNDVKVLISVNLFLPTNNLLCNNEENTNNNSGPSIFTPDGFELAIFNKGDFSREQSLSSLVPHVYRPHDSSYSLMPVKSHDATSPLYLVSTNWAHSKNITLFSIIENNGSLNLERKDFRFKDKTYMPWTSFQKGTTRLIDNGDARILDAIYDNGKIWAVINESCKTTLDTDDDISHSCVRIIGLDPKNITRQINCPNRNRSDVIRDFDIGHKGTYYFYPALDTNKKGHLIVIYGLSSNFTYPSLQAMDISEIDNCRVMINTFSIKNGKAPANDTDIENQCVHGLQYDCNRYGDYFSATRDPSNPDIVWASGEYYEGKRYSTLIVAISDDDKK